MTSARSVTRHGGLVQSRKLRSRSRLTPHAFLGPANERVTRTRRIPNTVAAAVTSKVSASGQSRYFYGTLKTTSSRYARGVVFSPVVFLPPGFFQTEKPLRGKTCTPVARLKLLIIRPREDLYPPPTPPRRRLAVTVAVPEANSDRTRKSFTASFRLYRVRISVTPPRQRYLDTVYI